MPSAKSSGTKTEVHVPADLGYNLADDGQKRAAIKAQLAAAGLTGATVAAEEPHPDGGLRLTVVTKD